MAEDGAIVEVSTVAFEGAMQRLKQGVHSGFIDPLYGTLTYQARMLSAKCQEFTPPRNVGKGNAAVMRDLGRIYFPQSPKTYKEKSIRRIVMNDDRAAWDAASPRFSGSIRNTRAIAFSEQWHQQNRNNRGRARNVRNVVTLGPQASLARAYMKKIKARVGWAKAGWNMGIIAFGGQVAANWIARHSVLRGKVTDGRNEPDPYVGVTNDTGWAQNNRGEGERIMRNAVNARIRDMYSYFDRMMKLAADKAQKAA